MTLRTLSLAALAALIPLASFAPGAQDQAAAAPQARPRRHGHAARDPGEEGRKLPDRGHGRGARPHGQDLRPRGPGIRARPLHGPERRAGRGLVGVRARGQQRAHALPSRRPRAQRSDQPVALVRRVPPSSRPGRAGRDPPRSPGPSLRLGRARRRHQHHHPDRPRPAPARAGLVGRHAPFPRRRHLALRLGRKTEYSLGLFHERTAGLSAASSAYAGNAEKDGYRNVSFAARLGFTPRPATTLSFTVRAASARTELDNFGGPGGDDPNSRPGLRDASSSAGSTAGSPGAAAGNGRSPCPGSGRDARTTIPSTRPIPANGTRVSTRAASSSSTGRTTSSSIPPTPSRRAWSSRASRDGPNTSRKAPTVPSEARFPSARTSSAGIYLLDHWEAGDRFFVTAGVRADRHSRAGTAVTFRVAPAYLIAATGTRLKATLGTGFKSPSLYQLFAPATSFGPVGNPLLRPERALGWDAGIEQRFAAGRIVLGLTWFENTFRDLVDFDFAAGYVNIGRARTEGLEVSAEARPAAGVRALRLLHPPRRPATWTPGTELLRRPRDKFSADAGFAALRTVRPCRPRALGRPPLRPGFQRLSLRHGRASRLCPPRCRPYGRPRSATRALPPRRQHPRRPLRDRLGIRGAGDHARTGFRLAL